MAYEFNETKLAIASQYRRDGGCYKAMEWKGHNISIKQRDIIKNHQENPEIDKNHYWSLVKVCKSDTFVSKWIFKMQGKLYVALQGQEYHVGECVFIYTTIDSKKGPIDHMHPIAKYYGQIDLEQTIDMFANEHIYSSCINAL